MVSESYPGKPTLATRLQQALSHHAAGELSQAHSLYRSILEDDAKQPDALHLLGMIAHQRGDYEEAAKLIFKAVQQAPDYAEAHLNLGNAFKALNNNAKAINSFRTAAHLKPDFAEAYCNIGNALIDDGDLDEALACCEKAIALNPKLGDAYNNLGNAYRLKGQFEEALSAYQNAISVEPNHANSHFNMGLTHRELGNLDAEFASYRRAIQHAPHNDIFWDALALSLEMLSFSDADADLWQDLNALISRQSIQIEPLIRPIVSAISHHPVCAEMLVLQDKCLSGSKTKSVVAALSDNLLLLRLMSSSIINDAAMERMLTQLRRAILMEHDTLVSGPDTLPFTTAMALHCFINEYVFAETKMELEAINLLGAKVDACISEGHQPDGLLILILASYRPLYTYAWAKLLAEMKWNAAVGQIIRQQVEEPLEEQKFANEVPSLTPIEDNISHAVRDQYERNPYPRWSREGVNNEPMEIEEYLRNFPTLIDIGNYTPPKEPSVLIAGCGTGQHALAAARRYNGASLTAIDLSRHSLGYAKRMSQKFGFKNITFQQADILELDDSILAFDIIECSGVLHHMADPEAGWRSLVAVLRPQGLMKVALYSEIGRHQVIRAQAMVAKHKYGVTPEGIRQCRQDIIDAAKCGDAGFTELLNFNDFYSLSGCRDLLFHVQEHRFNLLQVEKFLISLDLEFLGFEIGQPHIAEQFKEVNPTPEAWTSLQEWHTFEQQNPDAFIAMYQFWCQKKKNLSGN